MDDGAVLDGRPGPDHDRPIVGPDDGARPDAGFRTDVDLADQHGFGVDEGVAVDPRPLVTQCVESHGGYSNRAADRRSSRDEAVRCVPRMRPQKWESGRSETG